MSRTQLLGFAFLSLAASILTIVSPSPANAWGRRGHAIVCQTAATLASSEPTGEFLKGHSFDLGYYCNVPDLVWKKPATYKAEWTNHFMDMEIFDREMKNSKVEKPFEMSRSEFEAAFPSIKSEAGRSWWRIRELFESLDGVVTSLKSTTLSKEDRHARQADWLVRAGAIGHYVGDLSQPLHVTENYDGQLTEQKGVHAFFEDTLVDELFSENGRIEGEVLVEARRIWRAKQKTNAQLSVLELLRSLTTDSNRALAPLLKTDKRVGRKDVKRAAVAHRRMIVEQLAVGSVALAELYRRKLGWEFDGNKFYTFESMPAFIPPGPVASTPAASSTPVATPTPTL